MKTVILSVVLRIPDEEYVGDVYAVETKRGYYRDEIIAAETFEVPLPIETNEAPTL